MAKGKPSVRKVKFSAAELAYEPPADVDFGRGLVLHGVNEWQRYRQWRRKMALLEPDVRKAFPDDKSVNTALRRVIRQKHRPTVPAGRRKSA
jgi:hypothetical protein